MEAAAVPIIDQTSGRRIRELRLEKEWTQARLAHEAGLNEKTIRRAEDGQPVWELTLARIANALGVPLSALGDFIA